VVLVVNLYFPPEQRQQLGGDAGRCGAYQNHLMP
jgi:hypothetical protein